MKFYFTILAIFLLGLTSSCMNVKARYTFKTETDFDALKTYAWQSDISESFSNPGDAEHFMNAMNAQLESKGFRLIKDNADFYIRMFPAKKYTEVYITTRGEIELFKGEISVEFVSLKSGEVIWEGVAEGFLPEDSKQKDLKENIYRGVEQLMREFPPDIRH